MSNQKIMSWPDFSMYEMRLVYLKLPDGSWQLMMLGGDKHSQRVKALGFRQTSGIWLRKNPKIGLGEIRQHFSQVVPKQMTSNEVLRVMRHKEKAQDHSVAETTENLAAMTVVPLGENYMGQHVYSGASGRFIRLADKVEIETEETQNAKFLYASSEDDLKFCAEAMVLRLEKGEIFRKDTFASFIQTIYDTKDEVPFLATFGEALNDALLARLSKISADAGRNAFNLAVQLHEGLPPLSGEQSESVVPMPVGIVMQRLAGTAEKQEYGIYTPNKGNGALISSLPEGAKLLTGAAIPPHNLYLDNIPYEPLLNPVVVSGVSIKRGDHRKVFDVLDRRMAAGRSVFMLKAGDTPGALDADTKKLLAWVSSKFKIDGVVELDSSLFGTPDPANNRYVIAIGKQGADDNPNLETIPVAYSYDELWDWSDTFVSDMQRQAEAQEVLIENSYQAPYRSASKIGEATTMIPRNLLGPIREALAKLEIKFGNIDDFVSTELQLSKEELGTYYSPEQIDAIGLNIAAYKNGRGFINADQTGMGKGRMLAAMARFAVLNHLPVIFMTEKDNLLSDFWRDVRNTGNEELFKPFVFNPNSPIMVDGKRVIKATKSHDMKEAVANKALPEGANIMLATYGHFNKDNRFHDDAKAEFLSEVSKGAYVIMDEAHNAAGDSNINFNMLRLMKNISGVTYSSATYAKESKNFRIYSRVMPPSVAPHAIPQVLRKGGDALAEVFSSMLAEDSVMIRREHDLSNIEFAVSISDEDAAANEAMADSFAEILEGMAFMTGEIRDIINERNNLINLAYEQDAKIENDVIKANHRGRGKPKLVKVKEAGRSTLGWTSANFGSAFYTVLRQFMMSAKTHFAAREAIKALEEGQKPVIVIEQTNESLVKAAIARNKAARSGMQQDLSYLLQIDEESGEATEDEMAIANAIAEAAMMADLPMDTSPDEEQPDDEDIMLSPVTYRDVLHTLVDRISVVQKFENGRVSETEVIQGQKFNAFRAAIVAKIDTFPDIPVSPIDDIRQMIEDAGYTCSELTGRKVGVIRQQDGTQVVRKISTGNRNKLIHNFNSGLIDALVLSTAGASGISLHAGKAFADQRQRVMVELQVASNVAQRMQLLGRVNRFDQVCYPTYNTLGTGLPAESRLISMQNRKMREMSANTTSNRENNIVDGDDFDILNVIGDDIAFNFLKENPEIARRIMIDEGKIDDNVRQNTPPLWYVNQLTGRIGMLPVQEQRDIFRLLGENFKEEVRILDEKGENPLRSTEMDLRAKVVDSAIVYSPVLTTGSVFDKPIYRSVLEYEVVYKPLTLTEVMDTVRDNLAHIYGSAAPATVNKSFVKKAWSKYKSKESTHFSKAKYKDLTEALADPNSNVNKYQDRIRFIEKHLPNFAPGNLVKYFDHKEDKEVIGVMLDIDLPVSGNEDLLGSYQLKAFVPSVGNTEFTFYSAQWDSSFELMPYDPAFDDVIRNAVGKKVTRTKEVLEGNIFAAAEWSTESQKGVSAIYTDEVGERRRGIVLPLNETVSHINRPIVLSEEVAISLMQRFYHYGRDIEFSTSPVKGIKLSVFERKPNPQTQHPGGTVIYVRIPYSKESIAFLGNSAIPEFKEQLAKLKQAHQEQKNNQYGKAEVHLEMNPALIDQVIVELYENNMSLFVRETFAEVVLDTYNSLQARKQVTPTP